MAAEHHHHGDGSAVDCSSAFVDNDFDHVNNGRHDRIDHDDDLDHDDNGDLDGGPARSDDHDRSGNHDDHRHDHDHRCPDLYHHDVDHDHDGLRASARMRSMAARTRDERGAALVEAAITAPLLFFMLFGVLEMSLLFRDRVALDGVGHDAARAAAIVGNDQNADHHVLQVIADSGSPLADDAITVVVIFEASGPGAEVPAICLVASQADLCNRYDQTQFDADLDEFDCNPLEHLDRFWCPADRVVAQRAASGGPPDYIGVHIVLEREMVTGFFGKEQTLTSTSILRIEPRDL